MDQNQTTVQNPSAPGSISQQASSQVASQGTPVQSDASNSDILAQLQQVTAQELANRPDTPTMFTQGNLMAQGQTPPAPMATTNPPVENPAVAPVSNNSGNSGDDPLAKLLGLVKGEGGKVDQLKVKSLFVTVGNKIANKALERIVDEYRKKNMSDAEIIYMLLYLDKQVETGEISEELFMKLEQDNAW